MCLAVKAEPQATAPGRPGKLLVTVTNDTRSRSRASQRAQLSVTEGPYPESGHEDL